MATDANKKLRNNNFNKKRIRIKVLVRLGWSALVALIVFGLALYLGFRAFLWTPHLPNVPDGEVSWGMLEGMASLVSLALVLAGVAFVLREHYNNEIQQERELAMAQFDIYKDLFDRLMNPQDIEARRWILYNVHPCPKEEAEKAAWIKNLREVLHDKTLGEIERTPIGQAHVKRVLNTIDFIGFVDQNYWNMDGQLQNWLGGPIAKVWILIEPHVLAEAAERNEDDYYIAARIFGKKCVDEWRKNHSEVNILSSEKAT